LTRRAKNEQGDGEEKGFRKGYYIRPRKKKKEARRRLQGKKEFFIYVVDRGLMGNVFTSGGKGKGPGQRYV